MRRVVWHRLALTCSRLGRMDAYWWCLDRRDRVKGRSYDLPF